MSVKYRVYMTPLVAASSYGDEIEISDYVLSQSSQITKSIDSTDFSVGVYSFNDVTLQVDNSQGKFSAPGDSRSFFEYSRNLAKIRIVYDDGEEEHLSYLGFVNDDATKIDSDRDILTFTILGPDSVLKSSINPAGTITNGMTIRNAIIAVLNTSDIRALLNVYLGNMNPANDIAIDDGTKFDDVNKRDVIAELLGASNSVLTINDSFDVIVRNRVPNYDRDILYLYGKGDLSGRENIISISNYNTGFHRTFNSVIVKGGSATAEVTDNSMVTRTVNRKELTGSAEDSASQTLYGPRQKKFNFNWITSQATLDSVAQGFVDEFSYPKIELEVRVPTSAAIGVELLDQVSVSYPLQVLPSGRFIPVVGVTVAGDENSPLPYVRGSLSVDETLGFKVIEKTEDVVNFTTTLKLRQVGSTLTDGDLIVPTNVTTVTAAMSPYQILTSDDIIFVNAEDGDVDLTLPSPQALPKKPYRVVKIDDSSNIATISRYFDDQIYGPVGVANEVTLQRQFDAMEYATDRTNWYVIDATLGGGGGGSALEWRLSEAEESPEEAIENKYRVLKYADGITQKAYAEFKVPDSYNAGDQIKVRIGAYSPSSSNTFLLKAVATLIRKDTDAVTSTTNQRTTTNTAVTNSVANQYREIELDITSSTGTINSVAVSPGDSIRLELSRDYANDTDTADIRFVPDLTEVLLA